MARVLGLGHVGIYVRDLERIRWRSPKSRAKG